MTHSPHIFSHRICGDAPEGAVGDSLPIFPHWSFTKTVIAICALKLAEAGQIDLDEPVASEPFTLRQLLNHAAGLPDYGTLLEYHSAVRNDEEPWSRDDLLCATLVQGRKFSPGQGWAYSNVGYMLVRERLEEVAGQAFACLDKNTISGPLGLGSIALATISRRQIVAYVTVRFSGGSLFHSARASLRLDSSCPKARSS